MQHLTDRALNAMSTTATLPKLGTKRPAEDTEKDTENQPTKLRKVEDGFREIDPSQEGQQPKSRENPNPSQER